MVDETRYPPNIESERPPAGMAETPGPLAPLALDPGRPIADTSREMSAFVARLTEMAKAEAAVGPAQSVGGHTFVPLASVTVQAGFGLGFGGGGGTDKDRNQGGGSGGGAGGGGRSSARVIAIADVSEDGVQVRPVPDVTTLGLAFMALIALRMLRGGSGSRRMLGVFRRS
jgi:uncharacterized spore protein YtfJ